MLGKIVELRGITMEDGFEVYGGPDLLKNGSCLLDFATLTLSETPKENNDHAIYCYGLEIKNEHDGFKEILINNNGLADNKPEKDFEEDRIWVIVRNPADVRTTAKRVAGRYYYEGIFEMKRGDFIKINKVGAEPELYMAVNAGHEMFLIKRTR